MNNKEIMNEVWAMRRMRIVVQILANGYYNTIPVMAEAWKCEPTIEALAKVALDMYREETHG